MDTWMLVLIVVVVAAVAAAAIWWFERKRRHDRLQRQFGPEYERTVAERGDRRRAESELEERRKRVEALHIRPLTPEQRDHFTARWQQTQARFVDDPAGAVLQADAEVREVMAARGYPVVDFEQRAADISVDHPDVVTSYRQAHAVYLACQEGRAGTEELRQGFVHFRELFATLLGDGAPGADSRPEPSPGDDRRRGADPLHRAS